MSKSKLNSASGARRGLLRMIFRRWLVYPLLILVLLVFCADMYCEIAGLPDFAARYLRAKASENGLDFEFENLRGGVFSGINMEKLRIRPTSGGGAEFKAGRARLTASFNAGNRYFISFRNSEMKVSNGRLEIHLPGGTENGAARSIVLDKIEMSVMKRGKALEIEYLNGSLYGIILSLYGSIRKFFPAGELAQEEDEDGGLSIQTILGGCISEEYQDYALSKLESLPWDTLRLSGNARANVSLDVSAPQKGELKAEFDIGAVTVRGIAVKSVRGGLNMSQGRISSDRLKVVLANGDWAELNRLKFPDGDEKVLRTNARGSLRPMDLLRTIRPDLHAEATGLGLNDAVLEFTSEISAPLKLPGSGRYPVTANFSELSLSGIFLPSDQAPSATMPEKTDIRGKVKLKAEIDSRNLKASPADAELVLQPFKAAGISFSGIRGDVSLEGGRLATKNLSAALPGGDFIELRNSQLEFLPGRERFFKGKVSGKIVPDLFFSLVKPDLLEMLMSQVEIHQTPVTFDADVDFPFESPDRQVVSAKARIPQMKIRKVKLKNVGAEVRLAKKCIEINDFHASAPDNEVSGEMIYSPLANELLATVRADGNPLFLCEFMEEKDRPFLKGILRPLRFPEMQDAIEYTVTVHNFFGESPYYNLYGSIVVTDFAYNGVDFDYGACCFNIDADRLVAIPKIVLQKGECRALVSMIHDLRQKPGPPPASSPLFSPSAGPTDRVNFEVESNLSGNDVLKCILPDWKHESLQFTTSAEAKVAGTIDYLDSGRTLVNADISGCSFTWEGIPVDDASAKLEFKEGRLSLEGIKAKVCGGDTSIEFLYDFDDDTGAISVDIAEADYTSFLEKLDLKMKEPEKRGKLSCKLSSDFACPKGGGLEMQGKGSLDIAEAEIWRVPPFRGLADMLRKADIRLDWDELSRIECDFTLEKDRGRTDNIRTDGKLLSLEGSGTYSWQTQDADFRFRIRPPENAPGFKILSKMFDPVSWLLEARLHGKWNNLKWEQISAVKDLFR